MGKPKIYAHSCYIGHTGYNNHTRDFFRELSKSFEIGQLTIDGVNVVSGLSNNGTYYAIKNKCT